MSRIGNAPIVLPEGVELTITDGNVKVVGKLGQLEQKVDSIITVEKTDNTVVFTRANDSKEGRSKHGLYRALVANMVEGVTKGFTKSLIVKGVGFKSAIAGNKLTLNIGFSHPVVVEIPEGIKADIKVVNQIDVSGISKEKVGQFAAKVRKIKPVEPYHAYGIRYSDEVVIRKEGKKAK
jgi:large subunit ribosomal protein L6